MYLQPTQLAFHVCMQRRARILVATTDETCQSHGGSKCEVSVLLRHHHVLQSSAGDCCTLTHPHNIDNCVGRSPTWHLHSPWLVHQWVLCKLCPLYECEDDAVLLPDEAGADVGQGEARRHVASAWCWGCCCCWALHVCYCFAGHLCKNTQLYL